MNNNPRQVIRRYSLAFKKQVVQEYESGETGYALQMKYGIGGAQTITRWVENFGREGVRHKLMVIQQPEEQEHVKELEARIAELEKLAAQLSLDKFMLECSLAVAEEELGHKVKKKSPTSSSTKPKVASKKSKVN